MRFTREEFDTMVHELLYSDEVRFDALYRIAETTLRPKVRYWCSVEPSLRGRGYDDDIMQEIHIRLMKTTATYFLLRDGIEGPYNNDPEGFEDWMFMVAQNIKRDMANRVRSRDFKTSELEDNSGSDVCTVHGITEETAVRIDRLKEAVAIVLSSDTAVYKVLTWLAQFVFILDNNIPKHKSNDLIIEAFEYKTLFEMYDMVLRAAQRIPWLEVTDEQDQKILDALRKKHHSGVLYGEIRYRDFFMKQNGEPSGKKSISDWMNRMNSMLRRTLEEKAESSV